MNPLDWKREHQIALAIFFLVGCLTGVIVGYLAFAASSGAGGAGSLYYWLTRWFWASAAPWGLAGGFITGALAYASRLLRG